MPRQVIPSPGARPHMWELVPPPPLASAAGSPSSPLRARPGVRARSIDEDARHSSQIVLDGRSAELRTNVPKHLFGADETDFGDDVRELQIERAAARCGGG